MWLDKEGKFPAQKGMLQYLCRNFVAITRVLGHAHKSILIKAEQSKIPHKKQKMSAQQGVLKHLSGMSSPVAASKPQASGMPLGLSFVLDSFVFILMFKFWYFFKVLVPQTELVPLPRPTKAPRTRLRLAACKEHRVDKNHVILLKTLTKYVHFYRTPCLIHTLSLSVCQTRLVRLTPWVSLGQLTPQHTG